MVYSVKYGLSFRYNVSGSSSISLRGRKPITLGIEQFNILLTIKLVFFANKIIEIYCSNK